MLASRSVTLSELTNQDVTEDSVVHFASCLRTESVLSCIAWISTLLSQLPAGQIDLPTAMQLRLAKVLCPTRETVLRSYLQDGHHETWLHEQQLLLAAKAAILHGRAGKATQIGRSGVGDLLLGVSDILDHDASEVLAAYKGDSERPEIGLQVRNRALFRNEQARYVIGRYYDLLITRSIDYEHHRSWVDIRKYFKRQTKLTIEQFIGYALLYQHAFAGVRDVAELEDADARLTRVAIQIRSEKLRSAARSAFVSNRQSFEAAFESQANLHHSTYLPFLKRPMYETESGLVMPLSMELLSERASAGIYWETAAYMIDRNQATGGIQALNQYLGLPFQAYITDLFKQAHGSYGPGSPRYWSERELQAASGRREAVPDGVLIENDTVVLFEVTASGLTLAALTSQTPQQLAADVERKLRKKVGELRRGLESILDGSIRIPDYDVSSLRLIIPVLVTLHPLPQSVCRLRVLEAELTPHCRLGTPPRTEVGSVQLLTAEECEILEPLIRSGTIGLATLLREKTSDSATIDEDMKNYLWHRQVPDQPNYRVMALTSLATDAVLREVEKAT